MDARIGHTEPPVGTVSRRWTSCLNLSRQPTTASALIGVLPGEGIGREVIGCALRVLEAATRATGRRVVVEFGGVIGRESEARCGPGIVLPTDVVAFCEDIFGRGGAILNGPGGGRYVYELRRRFDLFLKISPLQEDKALTSASPIQAKILRGVDVLVTRENSGGIYQGDWRHASDQSTAATHQYQYDKAQVTRFLDASARLASSRQGKLTVVWKESGIPAISRLWRTCAEEVAQLHDVHYAMVDVDLMAYRLVKEPTAFDVVAAPNLFGDVLGDLGAVLLGSRGNSFSGNFNGQGHSVYQTNHGAAYDLAGTNQANPIGQIFSVAMLLRESFGFWEEAQAIEAAVRRVWRDGWRTRDVETPGGRTVGTDEMANLIAERVEQHAQRSAA